MCGIAGMLAPRRAEPEAVVAMARLLRHRGPDDEGAVAIAVDGRAVPIAGEDTPPSVCGRAGELPYLPREHAAGSSPWDVVLASRRLAILDLTPTGHQPLCTADGRLWIVHNGEIYNYVELRRELEAHGHRFVGGSDTEVALAAYREWGTECFARFNGMWAMAIWDGDRRALVLSRDRFGVKPLYVADAAGGVVFASEIKALVGASVVTSEANEDAVDAFLSTGRLDVRGAETCFAHVHQLEPGTFAVHQLDGARRVERFYDLGARVDVARDGELLGLLDDAVALRLRSDVAVGSALSGGLDSSAVVALAQRRLDGEPMRTFTYGSGDRLDEREYAAAVAARTGARNVVVGIPDESLPSLLEQVAYEQEEPIGSGSVLAQRQVMARAHDDGLKVLLDGQGGDEALAGYSYYVAAALADRVARGRLVEWLCELRAATRNAAQDRRWLLRATVGELRAHPRVTSRLRVKQLDDVVHHLPALLHYEDRNSMTFSIETRLPFLDFRVVELGLALSGREKVAGGWTKLALRRAAEPLLPSQIVWRREKVQFNAPDRVWLGGPLRDLAGDLGVVGSPDDDQTWRRLAVEVWRRAYARGGRPSAAVAPTR